MAETFHENNVKKSRKCRQCDWCGQAIEIGDSYRGYSFRDCGHFGRVTMHPECYSAMGDVAAEEGGWFTWSIGDFNRGCGCAAGDCKCGESGKQE